MERVKSSKGLHTWHDSSMMKDRKSIDVCMKVTEQVKSQFPMKSMFELQFLNEKLNSKGSDSRCC